MITQSVFESWISGLAHHFGKELTPLIRSTYYEYLSELLDDGLFIAACKQVIISDRFMPSAEAIASKVMRSAEEVAVEEWHILLEECAKGQITGTISDHARESLKVAGGFRKLQSADTVQQFQMAQTFFKHYAAIAPKISSQVKPQFEVQTDRLLAGGGNSVVIVR